jgi:endonuclease/exonuclease/phosphatase (EEP) superfamily protein YafD
MLQEARPGDIEDLGYDVVGSTYPGKGWCAIVGVRRGFGDLQFLPTVDRPGLVAAARITTSDGHDTVVVSVHVPSTEKGPEFARALMTSLDGQVGKVIVGGDFNAGPGIGTHPAKFMPDHGLVELTTSEPERNTLVRPQHPGTVFQIDHIFGRGYRLDAPMSVLPFADVGGPQISDHNALWIEISSGDMAGA